MGSKIRYGRTKVGNHKYMKIPYTKPSITEVEKKFAGDAVANGWGENCCGYINRFELDFARHLRVEN